MKKKSFIPKIKNLRYLIYLLSILIVSVYLYSNLNAPIFRKNVSVLNFGDVMFDRGVRNIIENRGRDPFEYVKKENGFFGNYDFVIANLEGPIVEMNRAKCQQKAYNFQFSHDTTDRLKSAGINMVNIANNHNWDCYRVGFDSTKKYLSESGIPYIGDNVLEKSFVIKEIHGKKVAFVGMDETVQPISISKFYPLVSKLKKENDYVIVDIHWGTEYNLGFTESQQYIAHKLIDNGVDVIFGHHPHVVEPVEIYKNGVVFYSLGNFVFDQDFGDTTVGLGAGIEFKDSKRLFQVYPFNIKVFAPDFMKGSEKAVWCEKYLKNIPHKGCSFEVKG